MTSNVLRDQPLKPAADRYVQHSTAQHSASQHSTAQHNTAHHSTTQCSFGKEINKMKKARKMDTVID
jgi:hypothetical protein